MRELSATPSVRFPALASTPKQAASPPAAPTDKFTPAPAPLKLLPAPRPKVAVEHAPGFDPANLDPSVKPTDDFFLYADGGWIKNNPIPKEMPRWGSFNALAESNTQKLGDILAAQPTDAPPGSNSQKLGDFYRSGMDTDAIEAAGLQPLQEQLGRIDSIASLSDLQGEAARLQSMGVDVLFNFGATVDDKNATQNIGKAQQSGLGLPERDYYLKNDEGSRGLRQQYVQHVTNMFKLMGDSDTTAAANAQTVMLLETQLAIASRSNVQLRDPQANYNIKDTAALKEMTPHFSWDQYFNDVGKPALGQINVGQPDYFQKLDGLLGSTPLPAWKTYMRWHLINDTARFLSSDFVNEDFHFKGTVMTGAPELKPRWKRVVGETDVALGEALGQEFVKKHFPPEAKARVQEMVGNIKEALRDSITHSDWMSDATKPQAIAKMDAFTAKIGYPDKWKDYSGLSVDQGPWVSNALRAKQFAFQTDLAKIGQPVDHTEWLMTPPTVNAYYEPTKNEIVFPAGILQPPFFNAQADDAINYGGIGSVIGHEMTHGFDDQGAQYDGQGNLRNWWAPQDLKNFQARTGAVEHQFDDYQVQPGLHINGALVKGEATADLGGNSIAYKAFKKSLEGKPPPDKIDGFNADQRFFLGFAQIWEISMRPEYERWQVQNDPHPHGHYRVVGTLSNSGAFADAFGGQVGDPMVKPVDQRIVLF